MMTCREHTITSKSLIPDDSIVEVLRILPAKSVLRFRCVSKSWNSMIVDPLFARLHIKRSRLLIYEYKETQFYETLKIGNGRDDTECVRHSFPFELNPDTNLLIKGSCNGILCFGIGHKDVNLWNPTTGKVYLLPKPTDYKGWDAQFGFGWDKSIDDYKVVRVLCRDSQLTTEIEVLTLKSKTWVKRVRETGLSFAPQLNRITYCNGALHWLASTTPYYRKDIVASFDLADEKLQKFPPPLDLKVDQICSLGVLGDNLCLCSRSKSRKTESSYIHVWVMQEYGAESSWIKLATLTCLYPGIIYIGSYVPLCFTKDGEIIATGNCSVVKSNINSGQSSVLLERSRYINPVMYEETVISLVE